MKHLFGYQHRKRKTANYRQAKYRKPKQLAIFANVNNENMNIEN